MKLQHETYYNSITYKYFVDLVFISDNTTLNFFMNISVYTVMYIKGQFDHRLLVAKAVLRVLMEYLANFTPKVFKLTEINEIRKGRPISL